MSNLPAPAVRDEQNGGDGGGAGDTEAVTPGISSTSNAAEEHRVEEVGEGDTETTSEENRRAGRKKSKSRAQVEREELAERIINFAEKEDHPVDLELVALAAKIKRELPDLDDQDELMDEIKDCAQEFFQRKRRAIVPLVNGNTAPQNAVQPAVPQQVQPATALPPPLQLYGQQAEQQ